ncbi:hypothetical protein ACS0TY_030722 [Phlomoides rotata]
MTPVLMKVTLEVRSVSLKQMPFQCRSHHCRFSALFYFPSYSSWWELVEQSWGTVQKYPGTHHLLTTDYRWCFHITVSPKPFFSSKKT